MVSIRDSSNLTLRTLFKLTAQSTSMDGEHHNVNLSD